MRILMTGATGYIGAAVAGRLAGAGHEVRGVARSQESAEELQKRGMTAVRANLREHESLRDPVRDVDAVIHLANTNDGDAGDVDREAVGTMLEARSERGGPFVYTSGIWVLGDTGEEPADEESDLDPLEMVAWRPEMEERVRASARDGLGSVVVRPAIVYGKGGGILGMMTSEARERGHVRVVGDGRQEWPFVHVDDLAELYLAALEAEPGSLFHAADGPSYRVRDLALAAALGAGAEGGVKGWTLEEARAELGGFADALVLDQRVSGARARRRLGWDPSGPTPLEELLTGSYTPPE